MITEQETYDYEAAKADWKICGARVADYMERMWQAENLLVEQKKEKGEDEEP